MKAQGRKQEASSLAFSQNPLLFQLTSLKKGARAKLNAKLDFSSFVQAHTEYGTIEQGFTLFDKVPEEIKQNVSYLDDSSVVGSDVSFSQENEEMFQRFAGKPRHKNAKVCLITQAMPLSNECRICHEFFSDYLQHVKHPTHVKNEAAHRAKSAKIFDDLLESLSSKTKRTRSEKILPNHDLEDEQFMKTGSLSKIRVISDQCPLRIENKREQTNITSTASIPGKQISTPISMPSLLLLP